jgi:large subunit ribosomal protein L23
MKVATEIIIRPIITEKYLQAAEKLNQYAFVVDKNANKFQIKEAIEKLYDVKVDRVNT